MKATTRLGNAVSFAAAILAGATLYLAMRVIEGAARPALAAAPEWLSLAANAGIEEAARLGLALAVAFWLRRLGLEPGMASLGIAASCIVAALENASYVAVFPTLDAYWRLGYAVPIHAGAAALFALSTALPLRDGWPPGGKARRAVVVAVSFVAAWTWHAGFNLVAALAPFPALPVVGTALNMAALTALVAATALRSGYWSLHASRRI